MKTIAVFFTAPNYDDYPFTSEGYRDAYHRLGALIQELGARFVIVRSTDTYEGNSVFRGGWEFANNEFVRTEEPIHVDTIYNKGKSVFPFSDIPIVVNDPEFDVLCTDKWKTYELFPDMSPKTQLVNNKEELLEAAENMQTDQIVAKPFDGEEGHGVFIGPKEEVVAQVEEFPYIVQEFIDTSGGIPGIVEGTHDFRFASISGKRVFSYARKPAPGDLRANMGQGGSMHFVTEEHIPQSVMDAFRYVDSAFERFPHRFYSIDMGLDRNGEWKLIELNSKLSLPHMSWGEWVPDVHRQIAEMLVSYAS